jgi:hypothetical protein
MKHATRHENGAPTNRRLALLYTMLAVALVFVSLAAIVVVGPGGAIGRIATYLILVVVIPGVVVGVFGLVGRGGGKDYDDGNAHDEYYHRL